MKPRRAIVPITLALLVCLGVGPASAAVAPAATGGVPAANPLLNPPDGDGRTVAVSIAMRVINVSDVDEVTQRFKMVGYLMARWKDPRLAFTPNNPEDRFRVYSKDEVWCPHFDFVNGVVPHSAVDVALRVSPDGTVNYSERSSAELSNTFRVRAFPFDREELEILIHVPAAEEDLVDLQTTRDDSLSAEPRVFFSLAQWDVRSLTTTVLQIPGIGGRPINEVRFAIAIARRHQFYLWRVFFPLFLMVVLSWTVLWIDPSELSAQTTISVTTILTLIAFSFAIAASLPKVPYLTLTDGIFLTCYSFAFLTAIEVTAVHWAERSGRTSLSRSLRRRTRWLLPMAFVVVTLAIVVRYLWE